MTTRLEPSNSRTFQFAGYRVGHIKRPRRNVAHCGVLIRGRHLEFTTPDNQILCGLCQVYKDRRAKLKERAAARKTEYFFDYYVMESVFPFAIK